MADTERHPLALASLAMAARVADVATRVRSLELQPPRGAVVLAGVGVGGAAADGVATLAQPDAARPVCVVDRGPLPPWLGAEDLVVCLGPGPAAARAREVGATVVEVGVAPGSAVPITDAGIADDRFDLGPLVAAGLGVLGAAGVVPAAGEQLSAAVQQLRRRAAALEPVPSAVDRLARRIGRCMPLVVGDGIGAIAARSVVSQVARSAKVTGIVHEFPAAAHDVVAGWGQHGDVTRQVFVAVVLRHAGEGPGAARRLDRYQVLLEEVVADVHRLDAEGGVPLAQLLDLVLVGEQLGVAMAVQEGLDPGPEPSVDEFREDGD